MGVVVFYTSWMASRTEDQSFALVAALNRNEGNLMLNTGQVLVTKEKIERSKDRMKGDFGIMKITLPPEVLEDLEKDQSCLDVLPGRPIK